MKIILDLYKRLQFFVVVFLFSIILIFSLYSLETTKSRDREKQRWNNLIVSNTTTCTHKKKLMAKKQLLGNFAFRIIMPSEMNRQPKINKLRDQRDCIKKNTHPNCHEMRKCADFS